MNVERLVTRVDNVVSNFLANPYVSATVTLVLILYSGFIAPELPSPLATLFDYTAVKTLGMFLVLVTMRYNTQVSLFVAIAFMVTMLTNHRYQVFGVMSNALNDVTYWTLEQANKLVPENSKVGKGNGNGNGNGNANGNGNSVFTEEDAYPVPEVGVSEWERFTGHLERRGAHPRPIHDSYKATDTSLYDSSAFQQPTSAGAELPEPQPENQTALPPSEHRDVHVGVFDEPAKGNYISEYATIGLAESEL